MFFVFGKGVIDEDFRNADMVKFTYQLLKVVHKVHSPSCVPSGVFRFVGWPDDEQGLFEFIDGKGVISARYAQKPLHP